jgi:hypothetical protein
MSQGDMAFTKFGHDAVLVENTATGVSLVYNYGTFSFDSPWLALDFLRGQLKYWLSVSSLDAVVRHYQAERRSIVAQELRLEPAERSHVAEVLARTEHSSLRYYRYDYYRDNCATRVRDVIDNATHGALRDASRGPARMTYREETLRLTAGDPLLALGLDFAMGALIDRPLTVWESEFLPARLAEALRTVKVATAQGPVSLVAGERVVLAAPGRDANATVPAFWSSLLIAGMATFSVLVALGILAARGRTSARVALAALLVLFGAATGLLGSLIAALAAFTDHAVTYRNENLLLCGPWSLPLVGFGIGVARGKWSSMSRARSIAAFSFGAALVGLALQAIPSFEQKNVEFVALFLPLWLGAVVGLSFAMRATRGSPASLRASEPPHPEDAGDSRLPVR